MQIKNHKDFASGLLFMAAGVYFGWTGSHFAVGNAAHMGPGYFPLLLGAVLSALGAVVVFKALVFETEDGGRMAPWAWRPVICIVLANLAFGAAMVGFPAWGTAPMGAVAGVFVLSVLSAKAMPAWRWSEVLLLAVQLTLWSYSACKLFVGQLLLWPAGH